MEEQIIMQTIIMEAMEATIVIIVITVIITVTMETKRRPNSLIGTITTMPIIIETAVMRIIQELTIVMLTEVMLRVLTAIKEIAGQYPKHEVKRPCIDGRRADLMK